MSYINKEMLIARMEEERKVCPELWKEEDIEYIKAFPVSDVEPVVHGRYVLVAHDKVEIYFPQTYGAENGDAE